jgi:hypothetical protein
MTPFEQILEVLIGQKVKTGTNWRVLDEANVEIVDSGGVMFRANPGALIMWPRTSGFPGGRYYGILRFGFSGYRGGI